MAASKVATVALRAYAVTNFASDGRTHDHVVDRQILEALHGRFIKHRASIKGDLVAARDQDRLGEYTTQHALGQRLDDIATLDERCHRNAVARLAVRLGNHEILRHVDETTCQVTRVSGLERGIGETLARAVRRDEVLQYVKAFAEVGRDRRLDDRAVRLGHQTTHTRQLANLGG